MLEIRKNEYWDKHPIGKGGISIITPTYNRANLLQRAFDSVRNQTFTNWEYIIIDDGSTDNTEEIVTAFMNKENHPIMYIKKENGGVHTARNLGYKNSRGELITNLDSDDELTNDALSVFWNAWNEIPEDEKSNYREIVAQCMDENGNRVGETFPENINKLPRNEARRICYSIKAEHIGCSVTSVMKENLFPEPEGVTFLTEDMLWLKLDRKYSSYYVNDMVRIYHMELGDHLSGGLCETSKKKTLQNVQNSYWESCATLNEWHIYKKRSSYISTVVRYLIMKHLLKMSSSNFKKKYRLSRTSDKLVSIILWIPTYPLAWLYKKKRM